MTPFSSAHSNARKRELGAFYTPRPIADQLVRWAIRTPDDSVLDPSFGSMVFLEAAAERLQMLGAKRRGLPHQLYGLEVDEEAHHAAQHAVSRLGGPSLFRADFLATRPGSRGACGRRCRWQSAVSALPDLQCPECLLPRPGRRSCWRLAKQASIILGFLPEFMPLDSSPRAAD